MYWLIKFLWKSENFESTFLENLEKIISRWSYLAEFPKKFKKFSIEIQLKKSENFKFDWNSNYFLSVGLSPGLVHIPRRRFDQSCWASRCRGCRSCCPPRRRWDRRLTHRIVALCRRCGSCTRTRLTWPGIKTCLTVQRGYVAVHKWCYANLDFFLPPSPLWHSPMTYALCTCVTKRPSPIPQWKK